MNDELQTILIGYIERADGVVSAGIDEAIKHAPDLVAQLLLWKTISSAIPFAIFSLVFMIALYIYVSGWRAPMSAHYPSTPVRKTVEVEEDGKKVKREVYERGIDGKILFDVDTRAEPSYSWTDEKAFKLWIGLIAMVISGFGAVLNTTWVQILVAPKFYLFEYAKSLV